MAEERTDYSARELLAQDAFIWGMPLVLMERSFANAITKPGLPVNQLFITRELALPKFGQIGPNVDTLIGHAWIDMADGPQVVSAPDTNGRYYAFQFQDMYMNNFAYVGRRLTGTQARAFVLTPPGWQGELPDDVMQIKATTSKVLLYIRTFLRDAEDLDDCRAVHSAYALGSLAHWPGGRTTPIARWDRARLFPHIDFSKAGKGFFDELDEAVRRYPPLDFDEHHLKRFGELNIGPYATGQRDTATEALLASAIIPGYKRATSSIRIVWPNGWARRENVPAFYDDPVQRAANNFFGKGTHRSDEACYWGTRQGGVGEFLDGNKRWRMRFGPGDLPPNDAFWSVTVYDEGYVLVDNPIDRYGILDRTKGIKFEDDGSLVIHLQADEPAEGISNWLPCPRAPFQMNFRVYQPREEVFNGDWKPPVVELIEE